MDVAVNGRTVWSHGHAVGHGSSATLAGGYVNLKVGAGTYDITTTPSR